jgi:hypothetical protein
MVEGYRNPKRHRTRDALGNFRQVLVRPPLRRFLVTLATRQILPTPAHCLAHP